MEENKRIGMEYMLTHIEKHIYPIFKCIDVKLEPHEILAICSFAYNIGFQAFTGLNEDGSQAYKNGVKINSSEFLTYLNKGKSPKKIARKFTGFFGKKSEGGLKKRRYLEALLYLNKINIDTLIGCSPETYNDIQMSLYIKTFYENDLKRNSDGFCDYNMKEETIHEFKKLLNLYTKDEVVESILPEDYDYMEYWKELRKDNVMSASEFLEIMNIQDER